MKHWIIGLVVIFVVFFVYTMFNGTPWGKENMKEKSAKYLLEKYGDEMEIKSVEYDFDNSSFFKYKYYTVAKLKTNQQIHFRVSKYDGEMVDSYNISFWEFEVKNEIKQQFNQVSRVTFQLRSDPIKYHTEPNGITLPSYHDIKEQIKDKDKSDLRLRINVNDDKQDNSMNMILNILLFLKEKDYKLSSISLRLESNASHKSYYLNEVELKDIIDVNSLTNKLK